MVVYPLFSSYLGGNRQVELHAGEHMLKRMLCHMVKHTSCRTARTVGRISPARRAVARRFSTPDTP